MDKVVIVLFIVLLAAYVSALEHAEDAHRSQSLLGVSAMKVISENSAGKQSRS